MSRIRANQITNQSADGAPTVQNGLVISGVTTSTTLSISDTLYHSGDDDTKIRFPSADTVSIETGGNEQIRINHSSYIQLYNHIVPNNDSTKDIGLTGTRFRAAYVDTYYGDGSNLTGITGTTINNNADNRLITGSGTANTLEGEATLTFTNSGSAGQVNLKRSTSTDQEAIFYYGSSNLEIETREATGIKLKTNKSDRVILTSGGNLGIGNRTSSPDNLLHVHTSSGDAVAHIEGAADGKVRLRAHSGQSIVQFADSASSTVGEIVYDHAANYLKFHVNASERARITSAGDILIGNTNGGAEAINMVGGGGGILISRSASGSPNDGQTLADIGLNSYSSSQTCSSADVLIRGQADGNHSGSSAGSALLLFTKPASTGPGSAPTERMRINKDGQVTQPSQPSFAAYRNADAYTLNNGIFTFNATRHNIGSHFNTSNHRFTAPVAGRYMFNFYSIYNTGGSSHQIQYRVNNSPQVGMLIHFSHAGGWDNVSYSQIINLNANDYVTMWSISNVNWHGNSWQCFTGELLS